MSGTNSDPIEERRKYVTAFNDTMIKIWREQIVLLGVVDTGALYRSTLAVGMSADGKFTSVTLKQAFNTYGLFVDYGTGSNTPRGRSALGTLGLSKNSGDLGEGYTNRRQHKRWFSRKYYASVMNIREFFANNLGKDMADTISNALTKDIATRFAV